MANLPHYKAVYTKAVRTGVLNVSQKQISELPHGIFTLHEFVPDENGWWELLIPHTLNVAHNNLKDLLSPENLDWHTAWKELKTLNASYNQISVIPSEILQLECIRYYILHHNRITQMVSFGASSPNLIRIELQNNNLQSLPHGIGECVNLQHLNVSHNNLSLLPASLSKCLNLQILEATNNNICLDSDSIESIFSRCTKLKELDLSNNRITSISSCLFYLPALHRLAFTQNKISCIRISDSNNNSQLADLYLGHNELVEFPFNALRLSSLKLLNLRANQLNQITKHISECCVHLERLDISGNNLQTLPPEISLIQNIKSLIVDGNPLRRMNRSVIAQNDSHALIAYLRQRLPVEIEETINAISTLNINHLNNEKETKLIANKQQLVRLPPNICKMSHLCHLELEQNKLLEITDLKCCINLQHVSVRGNRITDITALFALDKLEMIDVSVNNIKEIKCMKRMNAMWPKLHTLRLGYNQMTDLSECLLCIGSQTMSVLDIGNNNVSELPKCILQWKRLQVLDLSNNNFSNIPNELGLMESLNGLMLSGNRLRKMQSVINQGNTQKILQWLRNRIS
eukprot:287534_1